MDAWKIHQVENQISRSPNWGGFLADVFWLQIPPPNKNIQSRSWYLKARSWQWSSPASWWGRNRLSQLRMTWGIFWSGGRWGNARNGNFQEKVLLPFKNWFVSKTWFFTEPWLGWHIKNTHKDTHKPFIWWTCCIVSGKLATYLGELVVLQLPLLPSEPTSYQTPCRASYWKIPGFAFWKWSQTIPKWFTNWKTKWSHYLWSSYPAMHLPLKNLQCQSYSKMSADASQPNTNKLGFHKGFCHNTWPNRARSSLCWASRHVWREHMVQGSLRWLPPQVGSQDPAEMVSCIFNTKRNEVYCNHFGKRHSIVCRCCSF